MTVNEKTIWISNRSEPDTYADFYSDFTVSGSGRVTLNIACNGHYAVYLNGSLIKTAASADYPWYRTYDRMDITSKCKTSNRIEISVWYTGVDSQTYIKDEAGLFFTIDEDDVLLCRSGSDTKSRKNIKYRNGYLKTITSQLGMSFYYDNSKENDLEYTDSVESSRKTLFHMRKDADYSLEKRTRSKVKKLDNGYLIDLGEEQVGFLDMDFFSEKSQYIKILYAEHLVDGRVQNKIGPRDFSFEYVASKGKNEYMNPFRRIACRYIQLVCDKDLNIRYIGVRKAEKRVQRIRRSFDGGLLDRIYDTSVNTLIKCMHEHYEDCPWREQAMYVLDSRNQMLCGYYAFRGHSYQRENLLFIAKGQREDGLLSLCFPAGIDIPIPFFSLAYFMQVRDYVEHTGDTFVLKTLRLTLDKIILAFKKRIDSSGLIPNFEYPYWNFYEWADESNNEQEITRTWADEHKLKYDLILNCMYVYSRRIYDELYGIKTNYDSMIDTIRRAFYDPRRHTYRLSTSTDKSSQLGNSLATLIGIGGKELMEKTMSDESIIGVTLSMNTFYYDALLSVDDEYADFIIEDIKKKYGNMLEKGADTFWETENGWEDFDGAGSLCHGWSAIPVYYLSRFFDPKKDA